MQWASDHSHTGEFRIEPVRFLTVPPPPSPEQATSVALDGLPSPGEFDTTPREGNRNGGHRQRANPDLVQRLLRVLAPFGTEPLALEDLEWNGALMPFQEDGVRALIGSDRLLLADDMGLGKTVQVIAALRILRHRGDIRRALVAAPASLLDQWRGELRKWAPELSAIIIRGSASDRGWQWRAETDVTLVSYETLRSDFEGNLQAPVRRMTWDVVVADEAQRIKNRNDTSGSLKALNRERSWALTGTPIENHEQELASIMEFVDHEEGRRSRRYHPGPELFDRHRELQLRRKKGDVLEDLPEKQVTLLPIELYAAQRASYDKAEQEGVVYLRSLGRDITIQHVLELITRLKQICNADPVKGESSKLDDIRGRLELLVAQGHKALVFSQYTSDTAGVAAAAKLSARLQPVGDHRASAPAGKAGGHRGLQVQSESPGADNIPPLRRPGPEPAGGLLRLPPGPLVESGGGTAGRGPDPQDGTDGQGQRDQVFLRRYHRGAHRRHPGKEAGVVRQAGRRRFHGPVVPVERGGTVWPVRPGAVRMTSARNPSTDRNPGSGSSVSPGGWRFTARQSTEVGSMWLSAGWQCQPAGSWTAGILFSSGWAKGSGHGKAKETGRKSAPPGVSPPGTHA